MRYSSSSGEFVLEVNAPVPAGGTLDWTYGERSNPDLFLRYGFTQRKYPGFRLGVNVTVFLGNIWPRVC